MALPIDWVSMIVAVKMIKLILGGDDDVHTTRSNPYSPPSISNLATGYCGKYTTSLRLLSPLHESVALLALATSFPPRFGPPPSASRRNSRTAVAF